MNSVKNFIVRCWMALTLPYALIYLELCGIRGGEWNTFLLQKMHREMFSSLSAPAIYYFVMGFGQLSWFSQNILFIAMEQVTALCMFIFLYRIAPNTWAWYKIQREIRLTRALSTNDSLSEAAKRNIKGLLMQLAADVEWGFGDKPTPTSAVFEHAEWLAKQLGFWKGERKSLFPERK